MNNPFVDKKGIFSSFKLIVLKDIMWILIMGAIMAAITNVYNERPIVNVIAPIFLAIFVYSGIFLLKRGVNIDFFRWTLLIFMCNIYVPFGWLTSPGSNSAMPYYSLGILILSTFLIERVWEFSILVFSIMEVQLLLRYEAFHPEKFYTYTDVSYRSFDLAVNYAVVAVIIVYILYKVTSTSIRRDEELSRLSTRDQLTGIYNRRYIIKKLESIHEKNKDSGKEFVLAMIDLNKFKEINDNFGHITGDRVLVSIGNVLLDHTSQKIHIGRYGGDEFMIILEESNLKKTKKFIDELKRSFDNLNEVYKELSLEFSIGFCMNEGKSAEEMLQFADKHLYEDKKRNLSI